MFFQNNIHDKITLEFTFYHYVFTFFIYYTLHVADITMTYYYAQKKLSINNRVLA